jgi:hypothetical protein
MLCLICLRAEATIHVLDWPPDNPQAESHYCAACYGRGLVAGPLDGIAVDDVPPPFLSRPRFTIRYLMIAAGLSGLLDASLILFIRICVRGTPAEIGEWTMRAVLFGNVFCAATATVVLGFRWLGRWHWYAMTGRWVTFERLMAATRPTEGAGPPASLRRESAGERFFWALTVAWCSLWVLGALSALFWLCRLDPVGFRVWIDSRPARYVNEVILTYMLILPAGTLVIYSVMVAAALRHRDRERPGAGPGSPPVAGDDPRGSDS